MFHIQTTFTCMKISNAIFARPSTLLFLIPIFNMNHPLIYFYYPQNKFEKYKVEGYHNNNKIRPLTLLQPSGLVARGLMVGIVYISLKKTITKANTSTNSSSDDEWYKKTWFIATYIRKNFRFKKFLKLFLNKTIFKRASVVAFICCLIVVGLSVLLAIKFCKPTKSTVVNSTQTSKAGKP